MNATALTAVGLRGTVANIKITRLWCKETDGPCSNNDVNTLNAGKTSRGDIDGFEVPSGKKYYVEFDEAVPFREPRRCVGSGSHKIDNSMVARILRTC